MTKVNIYKCMSMSYMYIGMKCTIQKDEKHSAVPNVALESQ